MTATIRSQNDGAAAVWGSGGSAYDRVSETIADALDHVVARLHPDPGEKCLDVATGTGWTARLLKARGADVTGVDIGIGVIEAAKELATDIDFLRGRCGGAGIFQWRLRCGDLDFWGDVCGSSRGCRKRTRSCVQEGRTAWPLHMAAWQHR
jgi:SAM-dependent methyltransferase